MQIISTMTPQSTAEYLRARGMSISPDTLRRGIEQGVYPFGLCIKTDGSAVYQIFKRLLDEWIAERGVEARDMSKETEASARPLPNGA